MEIKPGYKQTEVGIIPEDWDLDNLDNLTDKIIDGTHHTPVYTQDGVPFLRVTDIQHPRLDSSKFKYVSQQEHRILIKRCYPQQGDLLLSKNGTIGIPKIVTWDWDFSIFVSLALLKVKPDKLSVNFLEQFIKSSYIKRQIAQHSKQGTVTNLHLEEIREFNIPLPPTKEEQEAIAEVLSDTDALIESLEQLIAKKRNIKQGAMQELLTGKRRLPGFETTKGFKHTEIGEIPKDWKLKELGTFGSFSKGKGISKSESDSGNIPCIRYGEIYTLHNFYVKSYYSHISTSVAKESKRIKNGDILFAGSGETKEDIGKCVAFVDDCEAYAGGDIVIFSPNGVNSILLAYALNSNVVISQKSNRGQGDTVVHISAANLSTITIPLSPSPQEQEAIATVLSDMDKELEALEEKLDKYRKIKQGMMAQLLTGKIRLV